MRVSARTLLTALASIVLLSSAQAQTPAQTVVFQQSGFPTLESEPLSADTLRTALSGMPVFADIDQLRSGAALANASLLVLPYGSAFPADAWPAIQHYLQSGGNLLLLGGEPLRVPVLGDREGSFVAEAPQDSYSRAIDFRHSYAVPIDTPTRFAWKPGYRFLPAIQLQPRRVYAQEGRLQGLAYMDSADETHLASPVIVADHPSGSAFPGSRVVALPFTPAIGFWTSTDGQSLIRTAADYAKAGATAFTLETQYGALRPGEIPELTLHLRTAPNIAKEGNAQVDLLQNGQSIDHATIHLGPAQTDAQLPFRKPLPVGLYTVRATFTPSGAQQPQEFAENGFVVEDLSSLETGDALGVNGDFLSLGGKPFLPVGTNYFTTEENGWDFSGPRNAAAWENDFADMQRHGVTFVRTGVWGGVAKFIDPSTGGVNERFLRNLEAYLAAAHRHHIAVNFTFFAFTPRVSDPGPAAAGSNDSPPPPNPYLDAATVDAEKAYVVSVVARFGKIPWLSYDLINEPSFSNPRSIFHGNVPNGDAAELAAWREWLQKRYIHLASLADAWRTTESQLAAWTSIPLPKPADLVYTRYGNPNGVRALDYNLFAQDMFSDWVRSMIAAIHSAGSRQLINVGQDEGGVTNRLLNPFYATAGVSFTTNHTYWQDDALLWDSVAAKRPGIPNITGETGYQPAWNPDGAWRYDELTGTAIEERKWALGFAAGSSGAMQWDWAREPDFGIQRSDGSAKVWEAMLRDLGAFAQKAAPWAAGITLPEVAIVLPQSLQLSTLNTHALQAQQTAVRVLYQYNRVEAYAVGEYQTETLGSPRLIILPSPYGLADKAWAEIESRVRAGAVVLVSGPFSADEHLHANSRANRLGIDATLAPLQLRDAVLHLASGEIPLEYTGMSTTVLDRATLANGKDVVDLPLGKGRLIFSAYPLELNSNLQAVAAFYAQGLQAAGVSRTYTTTVSNPGILICPTRLPHATLYVLTSETETTPVSFTDTRSQKTFSATLQSGRAALLLIGEQGNLIASYNWSPAGQ